MAASACAARKEGWAPGQPEKGTRGEGGEFRLEGTCLVATCRLRPSSGLLRSGRQLPVAVSGSFSLSPRPRPLRAARPSGMSRCLKIVHWKGRGESGKTQRDKGAEYACASPALLESA